MLVTCTDTIRDVSDGSLEVDYLVVGAGAAGLAFTDALISESDATVLMVDRRHSPGGHWNDAYPFVRLHQPSAFYGVNSRNLGHDRIDDTVIAVYSPRLRPGVPVSFPVEWEALDDVVPADFNVHTALRRLGESNPWSALMPRPQQLHADLIEGRVGHKRPLCVTSVS